MVNVLEKKIFMYFFIVLLVLSIFVFSFYNNNSIFSIGSREFNSKVYIKKNNAFSSGLDWCMSYNECPEGTVQNCRKDYNGDWFYTCDSVVIDCFGDPMYSEDCSRVCNKKGWIYQYSTTKCCPYDFPYLNKIDNLCYNVPQGVDNYFTKNSECNHGDEKCVGNLFYNCIDSIDKWIFKFENKGKVIGKCGVECNYGDEKCVGKDYYSCSNGVFVNNGKQLNKCDVECITKKDCIANYNSFNNDFFDYFSCINNVCSEKEITVFFKIGESCVEKTIFPSQLDGKFYFSFDSCMSSDEYSLNFVFFVGIVIGFTLFLTLLYFYFRRKFY